MSMNFKVCVRIEDIVIPTYLPAPPDQNPMFPDKRVHALVNATSYFSLVRLGVGDVVLDVRWKLGRC
jgi:hypothetical protein